MIMKVKERKTRDAAGVVRRGQSTLQTPELNEDSINNLTPQPTDPTKNKEQCLWIQEETVKNREETMSREQKAVDRINKTKRYFPDKNQ